jgi:hypothetical protein
MRASIAAEAAGLPSVTVVARGFTGQATAVAKAFGLPGMQIVTYPGKIVADSDEVFDDTIRNVLFGQVVAGLTDDRPEPPAPAVHSAADAVRSAGRIAVRGSLDEVTDEFERRGWMDGLPFVPPTVDRVTAMLARTPRDRHESLGVMLPSRRSATVWSVAVNGVMAGCRPEYMPLLVALVQAMADPQFKVGDAGATPGWEPLVVVNGPVIDQLGFNSGAGVLRIGRRANSSVGRFARLYLRNVAGLRILPDTTDKASIGQSFHAALAEDEASCRALGWRTLAEENGYLPGQSTVNVQSVVSVSPPIYTSGVTAEQHLRSIADMLCLSSRYYTPSALWRGTLGTLLVMSPYVADILAAEGLDKRAAAGYIADHARMPKWMITEYANRFGAYEGYDIDTLVAQGTAPPLYGAAADDDEVPVFPWPEEIRVVVAGDSGRNQSRAYLVNHIQGFPTHRALEEMPRTGPDAPAGGKANA